MSPYANFNTRSHYSLLSALPKIPDLVKAIKEGGYSTACLTDIGNLYGAIEFYKECKKAEIKPIIGLDAYRAPRTRKDKETKIDSIRSRAILIAKNETGYKNLIKLVTLGFMEGFYYKPRIDKEIIEKYKDGLVYIEPSSGGSVTIALKNQNEEKALAEAKWLKEIFGANFYMEISHQKGNEDHENRMSEVKKFAQSNTIPIIASLPIYYISPDDKRARETLRSIQNAPDYDEIGDDEYDLSLKNAKEFEKLFKKEPEALLNNAKLVEEINLELKLGSWVFPDYKTESGKSYDDELRNKVYDGLKTRNLEKTKTVEERIEYELKVIKDKGYSPYFLVVSDLLNFAHKEGILTTIRGSVAGSLVTYLAQITNVNPLEYNLPFERFLNPERPSAPDIDMDYADSRRDEMIEYAKKKYGADKVAQIGTFGTMMARGAVRDVTRALGYEYSIGDTIAKLIPMGSQGFPMTIDHALELVPELKEKYKKEPVTKEIIDMAKKIEGCARHISVHAAGVVISPKPLTEYVPLQYDTKGEEKIITQYDMHSVEEAGLLKFDFLGIRNLSILADAVSLAEKIEGKKIDIENVPLNDKKTFEMLAKGITGGLFQLNGDGMTKYLKDLKPTNIRDISVMVALYRPGPMNNIDEYIARKHKQKPVTYLHPKMKEYLEETYGVLVYQEDVLMTAIKVAGYTWGEVDKFRKAIGKKIPEEMKKQHAIFVEGCIKHSNLTKEKAEAIWTLFEPFQGYGFNKAHAASYGKVAYQTAYMKANFPAIYMSAVLTAESGDTDKVGEIIAECKRMEIPVLPPDINESFEGFSVVRKEGENDKIRFGLVTIKNFGAGIAKSIIDERKENGKFVSLADFLERIADKNLNKKSLESLIKAGALDSFGERGSMLGNLDNLLLYHKEHQRDGASQNSLFDSSPDKEKVSGLRLLNANEASMDEKLAWEKELLGLYISGHPLDKFRERFEKRELNIRKAKEMYKEGMEVILGGIIEEVKQIITKKNEVMVFAKITDLSGSIETVVFPKVLNESKNLVQAEKCIAIKGRISERNGEKSLIAEKIKALG
jgi:DNA polymerase-3 subunit alpha